MPLKRGPVKRAYDRDYYRRKRSPAARERANGQTESDYAPPVAVDDQVRALTAWASTLECPPGHPRTGKPMVLPDYMIRYLSGALAARESLLSVARKNAKSTGLALLALGYLCGPLRAAGWRGAVVSLNLDKSREFLRLAVDLARSNALPLKPYTKRLTNPDTGAELECLPATADAGHASGYDAVFLDELGLYPETCRPLIRGLYSSITARDGRIFCISIRGDNPVLEEILQRKDKPDTYVQLHAAAPDCSILDASAWHKANPGLDVGIKSLDAMRFAAESAAATPSDIAYFRSHELNQRMRPDSGVLVTLDDWIKCETDTLPEPVGPAYLGLDLGAVSSLTAATVYWPETGLLRTWGAFPAVPDLDKRGQADGVGRLYLEMAAEGSIRTFGERIPDYGEFMAWVMADLDAVGAHLVGVAYDRFRKPEIEGILDALGLHCPRFPRGTGASSRADGSHDVRAFQRAVLTKRVQVGRLHIWRAGLRFAVLRHDPAGNPALDKSKRKGRIDCVSAGVLAVGLAVLYPAPKPRPLRWAV